MLESVGDKENNNNNENMIVGRGCGKTFQFIVRTHELLHCHGT